MSEGGGGGGLCGPYQYFPPLVGAAAVARLQLQQVSRGRGYGRPSELRKAGDRFRNSAVASPLEF